MSVVGVRYNQCSFAVSDCSTFVLCTALPLISGFRVIRDRFTLDVERKCKLVATKSGTAKTVMAVPVAPALYLIPRLSVLGRRVMKGSNSHYDKAWLDSVDARWCVLAL